MALPYRLKQCRAYSLGKRHRMGVSHRELGGDRQCDEARHRLSVVALTAAFSWRWNTDSKDCRGLGSLVCSSVPTSANTCVPNCTPAGVGVKARTDCARCCRTIICTPMHATIDARDAPRGQWMANSGVRSIN